MKFRKCIAMCGTILLCLCLFSGCVNQSKTVGEILQDYTAGVTEAVTDVVEPSSSAETTSVIEPTTEAVSSVTEPATQNVTQDVSSTQPSTGVVDPSVIGSTVNSPMGFKSWFRINGEDYISNTLYPLNVRLIKMESELSDAKFVNDIYAQYQKNGGSMIIRATNNVLYCAEVDYVVANDAKVNDVYAMGAFSVTPYSFEHNGLFSGSNGLATGNVGIADSYVPKEYQDKALKAGDSYKMYYVFLLPKGYDKNFCMEFSYLTSIKDVTTKNVFVAVK